MAIDLVLTGTNGFTLFSNKDDAPSAATRVMWDAVEPSRASGWKEIQYTGWDGLDAMFLGQKPERNIIHGHINADNTANMVTLKALVLGLGKAKVGYKATGPIVTASSEFLIVGDIKFAPIGPTGGSSKFTIDTVIIGTGA